MKKRVEFTVHGPIKGKGRPRFTRVGNYVRTYTPDTTVSYENLIKMEYIEENGEFQFDRALPLILKLTAYYSIPKSVSKKNRQLMIEGKVRPLKKPDADNVMKVVCDALNGVAYVDDVQIVTVILERFYSEYPHLDVSIWEAE